MKQEKWSLFLEDLKKNCHENRTCIQIAKFFELLSLYNLAINQKEKDDLLECLGMKDEGNSVDLNIKLFFVDLKQLKDMHKIYKTINLEEREDEEEIKCIQNKLLPISEEQLLQIISEVKGFKDLHREFKKWDLDTNGYLTITELNQIFIQIYPKLEGRSLYKIFRPFSSIQNKSLVEYKKLTEYLKGRIEQLPQKAQPSKLKAIIDQNKELDLAQQNIELIEKNDKLENENNIDKIEIKPQTTKRMDNIRKEILKSFEEIPELGTFYPQETTQIPPDSDIKLKQRTRLEALLSPKVGQRSLPLLTAKNLQKTMGVQQNVTVLSPKQVMSSKISNCSAVSSPFFSKSNQILKHKLGYEWKNIMKSLNAVDLNSSGLVTRKEFENCVQRHGVYLSRDELSKVYKKYNQDGDVNYYRISVELGLHKSSYDYMKPNSKYKLNVIKIRSIKDGPNDTASQFGDILRAAKTERVGERDMTTEAIRFIMKNQKESLLKIFTSFDRKNTGKIGKDDFIKILRTHGIYLNIQAADKFIDKDDGRACYPEFVKVYE